VRVRTKVLSGLTKAVAFTDAESLKGTLRVSNINVPGIQY